MRFTFFTGICALATLSLPLVTIKQNRIVSGEDLRIFELHPLFGVAAVIYLGVLFYIVLRRRANAVNFLAAACIFMVLILGAVWSVHTSLAEWDSTGYGRISFAGGFWFFLLTLYLFLSYSHRESGSARVRQLSIAVPLLIFFFFSIIGLFENTAIAMEFVNHQKKFLRELLQHLYLSLTAVGTAAIIGIPAGIKAARSERWRDPIFKIVSGIQTVPSLALFGLMIAPLAALSSAFPVLRTMGIAGIGTAPALIALSLYALLPVIRNTFTGIMEIDSQVRSAALGMGMNRRQIFRYIELPLAAPLVLTGIRISLVQSIGNTAVAALIGAGGLGTFIFQGLGQSVPDLILLGVIPVILLSVLMDRLFYAGELIATPKGVRAAWQS